MTVRVRPSPMTPVRWCETCASRLPTSSRTRPSRAIGRLSTVLHPVSRRYLVVVRPPANWRAMVNARRAEIDVMRYFIPILAICGGLFLSGCSDAPEDSPSDTQADAGETPDTSTPTQTWVDYVIG